MQKLIGRGTLVGLVALSVLGLDGCGRGEGGPETLLGTWRLVGSYDTIVFRSGGECAIAVGPCRYSADGSNVVITPRSGGSYTGRRTGADSLEFERAGAKLVYARSKEEPSLSAQRPAAPAAPTPAPTPAGPVVDRSVPLSDYIDVSDDRDALRYLIAAFRSAPLSDDDKLNFLSDEGAKTQDAFARRDLMPRALPAIDAKIATYKARRYYKLTVGRYDEARTHVLTWSNALALMTPYDLAKKGYAIECIERGSVGSSDGSTLSISFGAGERVPQTCLLPVPDETTARALEAVRTGPGFAYSFIVRPTFYFYVVGASSDVVSAVLTHAQLELYPHAAPTTKIADLDVAFPQAAASP